jgi:hypothetical protein
MGYDTAAVRLKVYEKNFGPWFNLWPFRKLGFLARKNFTKERLG